MEETKNEYKNIVDRRLIIRQRIFLVIIVTLVTISIMNIVENKIGIFLGASGFLLSTAIGLALSRMFKIFWHAEKGKVISQLDTMGTILLVLYIGIEIFRKTLFSYWLSGAMLNAFGLIVLSGLLFGRFLGTHLKIQDVLQEKSIEMPE